MSAKQRLSTSLAGLSLALLMSIWAPSASAFGCSCMCMEGSPQWICTDGFFQNEDPACATTECPAVDSGSATDTTDTGATDTPSGDGTATDEPVEPPAAADGSGAESGLACSMRKIYRPDLGRYKRHKVCRLTAERRAALRERLAQAGERHESAMERLQAKHERREARRAERRAQRAERRNERDDDDESTGDDD